MPLVWAESPPIAGKCCTSVVGFLANQASSSKFCRVLAIKSLYLPTVAEGCRTQQKGATKQILTEEKQPRGLICHHVVQARRPKKSHQMR